MINLVRIQRTLQHIDPQSLRSTLSITSAGIALVIGAALLGNTLSVILRTNSALTALQNGALARDSVAAPHSGISYEKKDYSFIHARPLLQISQSTARGNTAPAAPLKQSDLPLSLIGTFVERGHSPYAIIEEQKKNTQEVFSVDDTIFGEATLKKVLIDRVEILRNGTLEVLILDERLAQSTSSSDSDNATHFSLSEAEVDKALENLPLMLTQARAVPYFKEGKAVGLRMFAIRKDSMFERIGLKNGDILKTLNGNNLGDISQAMRLFEQLKAQRNLTLSLERNGEETQFSYDIR